ncbi:NUDIX hydrolase [Streptomyces chrestomyceticus]|uniref:NUDIX hydrolase n=1 Tax=Streptomyces chrestomyceticus TaxID=68185 RepID=A0ABU7WNS1_9ACTN
MNGDHGEQNRRSEGVVNVFDPSTAGEVVRAAGCVLWRRSACGNGIELALVHRPKWSDWSFPKGKLKRGEDWLAGALREVHEETGMNCHPGTELPTTQYFVQGRPKQVRYWAAELTGGTFKPNREVDRLLWLPPAAARRHISHDRDRPLVDHLLDALKEQGCQL